MALVRFSLFPRHDLNEARRRIGWLTDELAAREVEKDELLVENRKLLEDLIVELRKPPRGRRRSAEDVTVRE